MSEEKEAKSGGGGGETKKGRRDGANGVRSQTNGVPHPRDIKAEMLEMQKAYLATNPNPPKLISSPANNKKEPVSPVVGEKRKATFPELFTPSSAPPTKKKKGPPLPKNACVMLNEYKPGLEYSLVSREGQSHEPLFVMKVSVNGKEYEGKGKSKKLAKQAAAENALKSIIQFKNPLEAQMAMGLGNAPVVKNVDFTSDNMDQGPVSVNSFEDPVVKKEEEMEVVAAPAEAATKESTNVKPEAAEPQPTAKPKEPESTDPPPSSQTSSSSSGKKDVDQFKNPVMSLNELKPGLTYDCGEIGQNPDNAKKFRTTVTIDGKVFEGFGTSKKLSKAACARACLYKLYGVNFTPETNTRHPATPERTAGDTNIPVSRFCMDQELADTVAKIILEKFDSLVVGNMVASRRKVIAGIVQSRGAPGQMNELKVVSVTTGTKCINGEFMSDSGNSLNDCHAEILSRRCLMRYLYNELEKIAENNGIPLEDSILEKGSNGGYRVKNDVHFHLYINTAPCGDARIFSPHEDKQVSDVMTDTDSHINRRSRGQLRTKIESGEGTIPVTSSEGIQTWDGVMQGSRLLTMSCSDKVCRWNVLGVQGALLAYYLEPVYLYSIILGSLFHPTHLLRAVTGRIEGTLTGLPRPYRLNTPKLNLLTSPEARQPGKSPNHSLNWTIGDSVKEIVDATRGKTESRGSSRLSKSSLFLRWLKLTETGKLTSLQPVPSPPPTNYALAKQGNKQFQTSKQLLFTAFKKASHGDWVKKPIEQDDFHVVRKQNHA